MKPHAVQADVVPWVNVIVYPGIGDAECSHIQPHYIMLLHHYVTLLCHCLTLLSHFYANIIILCYDVITLC